MLGVSFVAHDEVVIICCLTTFSSRINAPNGWVNVSGMMGQLLRSRQLAAATRKSSLWSIPCCTARRCWWIFGTPSSSSRPTVHGNSNNNNNNNNIRMRYLMVRRGREKCGQTNGATLPHEQTTVFVLEKQQQQQQNTNSGSVQQQQQRRPFWPYLIEKVKQLADVVGDCRRVWVATLQVLFVYLANAFHALVDALVVRVCARLGARARLNQQNRMRHI